MSAIEGLPPDELLPMVYEELRRLASRRLAAERPGQTLQPTAPVHEACLRLAGDAGGPRRWTGRGAFLAAAAEAMRRILIENARRKAGPRRGGGRIRAPIDPDRLADDAADPDLALDLLDLDEALTRLEAHSPARADLVWLRFFAGLTMPDAAESLGISVATAERRWTYARAWLLAEISKGDEGVPGDFSP